MKKIILFFGALAFAGIANAASHTVHVKNMQFDPKNLNIKAGDEVVWSFEEADHTTTSGSECNKDDKWDSGTKGVGTTFSHTFSNLGTFMYFCKNHCPGMEGTVTVTDVSGIEAGRLSVQKQGLSNFPNPFTGTTSFRFYAEKSSRGVLEIFSMDGKKLSATVITAVSGINTIPIALDLAKGTYVARLSLEARLPEYKLILKQE
jgi:plastocyanin